MHETEFYLHFCAKVLLLVPEKRNPGHTSEMQRGHLLPPLVLLPPHTHELLRGRRPGPKCAVSRFYGLQGRLKAGSLLAVNLIATHEVKVNIFTHDKDSTLNS